MLIQHSRLRGLAAGFLAQTLFVPASGAAVRLVADLDQTPVEQQSTPAGFVEVFGVTYFAAADPLHGRELWRTDGSEAGTWRVADACPGSCSGLDSSLASPLLGSAGGVVLFVASQGDLIAELWASDGTAGGTRRLRRLPGIDARYGVYPLGATSSLLFFSTYVSGGDRALWASDGTVAGTRRLAAVGPDAAVVWGDDLFFSVDRLGAGRELWTSDGTPAGTRKLLDTCTGPSCSFYGELAVAGGHLYFKRVVAGQGQELWRTDGTAAGAELVRDVCPGSCSSAPLFLVPVGNRLLFSADDGVHARELWATDDASGETVLLADATTVTLGGAANPRVQAVVGGRAWFAVNADPGDLPLWVTDGTPAGTRPAPELFPHGAGVPVAAMTPLRNLLVFVVDAGSTDNEVWALVPGIGAPQLLADGLGDVVLGPGPASQLFFLEARPLVEGHRRWNLWSSDGTAGGTRRVAEDLRLAEPWRLATHGGAVVFAADDGVYGFEPWFSDGTVAGTHLLRNVAGPTASSSPADLVVAGDSVLFSATDDAGERGIWWLRGGGSPVELRTATYPYAIATAAAAGRLFASDGESLAVLDEGAGALTDLVTVNGSGELTPAAGGLFFTAREATQQLWFSDGTAAGTSLVADLGYQPGCLPIQPCPTYPRQLVGAGASVFLVAHLDDEGVEQLWVSDGTAAGTHPIDVPRGFFGEAVALGDRLIFELQVGSAPWPLWVSDGTDGGTHQLVDLPVGGGRLLTPGGPFVYFVVGSAGGDELWRTDGTPEGTVRVSALGAAAHVREMAADGGRVFLTVFTEESGEELWVSAGGVTEPLADLRPGPAGSGPAHLRVVDGRLYFAADDGSSGQELWGSDGTAAGTGRVADLAPGPDPSSPGAVTAAAGGRLLFAADDGVHGRELFELDATALPPPCPPGSLCLREGRFAAEVHWRDFRGRTGSGSPVPYQTAESGLFWFFRPANWELMLKVLDGCAVNGHYWVFAAATTNVEYTLHVTDTESGADWQASNPLGHSSPVFADVRAFACGPSEGVQAASGAGRLAALDWLGNAVPGPATSGAGRSGVGEPPSLGLHGGAFEVRASWRDSRGHQGFGSPVPYQTDESGLFWFFHPGNWELMVKVIDGCALNGHYWVLAAGTTNVGFQLEVDGAGGSWSYENPVGTRAPAVLATRALPCE
jgi:ELWxxDGT repeat protein